MKSFLEFTGIETLKVCVVYHVDRESGSIIINGQLVNEIMIPVSASITIETRSAWITKVEVDGINITDYLPIQTSADYQFRVPGPFYHWWHQTSGQGWLLYPCLPG